MGRGEEQGLLAMEPNYRRCVSCRRVAHRQEFWRVIRLSPSHEVILDQGMGRSVYLCPTARCLRTAQKKGKLGRALKATVPEAIWQVLEQRLEALGCLSSSGDAQ